MAIELQGSCRCGAVTFSVTSHTPYPYQLCYCSICRKTDGGGGFAINIMGDAASLKVSGEENLGLYRAEICDDRGKNCETSTGERRFCIRCGTALWLFDPSWPDIVHPFASSIDTPLPTPRDRTHLMLRYKASWVEPTIGPHDASFEDYPAQSIEQWHKQRGLWID
jgi:hypothetical protein